MTHAEMPPTSEIDCGDNSCQFATSKGGMRTNGGCTCYEKAGFHRSAIRSAQLMLPEIRRLREALCESQARESRAREEIERLKKLADMDAAIIDGMRRVLATSRMALNGNTLPLKLALESFDTDKLQSHNERAAASRSGEGE